MKRLLLAVAVAATLAIPTAAWADTSQATQVVVPRGQPVQFAFTADTTQPQFPVFTAFTTFAENAIVDGPQTGKALKPLCVICVGFPPARSAV